MKHNGLAVASLVLTWSGILFGQAKQRAEASEGASLTERIRQVRSSVVPISATFKGATSNGTGFIINSEGFVVTARHVVRLQGSDEIPDIRIQVRGQATQIRGITISGAVGGADASIVAEDVEHDIAVLKPASDILRAQAIKDDDAAPKSKIPPPRSPVRMDPHKFVDGEQVFSSGYPLKYFALITNAGYIASSEPTTFELIKGKRQLRDVYELDLRLNHGNSGGPLFSMRTGDVIGLADAIGLAKAEFFDETPATPYGPSLQIGQDGLPQKDDKGNLIVTGWHEISYNSGIAVAIPAEYITQLLNEHHIAFDESRPKAKP